MSDAVKSPWIAAFGVVAVVHLVLNAVDATPWDSVTKCLLAPLLVLWVIQLKSPGLLVLALWRGARARLGLALGFGTFYTLLGFLGIVVVHPAGMRLDWPENLFHLIVGPLMLALGALAWRAGATAGPRGRRT